MPGPVNCRFCHSTVYRADLVTIRTCQLCCQEEIERKLQGRRLWARRAMRRALRTQREIDGWRWEV
jgi:hypothetical protein